MELEAAGLDATEVEDVVDQAEQVFGINVNMLHKSPLPGVERAFPLFLHKLCETDDGVERGAEFMADAGHELTFELVEAFRFLVPGLQLGHITFLQGPDALFGQLAVGYVANDSGDVDAGFRIHGA